MNQPTTRKSNAQTAFIIRGTDSTDCPYIHRELIWPSCDSPAHRKYIEAELTKRANRLNQRGYKLTVHFQVLDEKGLWTDSEQPA